MKSSHEPRSNTLITKDVTDASGNSRVRIDHGALRRVLMQKEVRDKPIALISIAGCMRTGKSFLMNFILRYFQNKGWENANWIGDGDTCVSADDFAWKGGAQRVTTGLRIFHEVFEVPWKDNTMKVMVMDTQGLFDFQTPEIMNKTMLTLTTLLSSVQIFNTVQQINAQYLSYLKTCVDFALEAASSRQSRDYLRLQRLIFLLRDFPDVEDDGKIYTLEYGKNHLARILGSDDGGYALNMIRHGIKQSFQEVDCFPLPHPGKKAIKVAYKGSNKDLDKDFLQSVKSFVEEIASPSKLTPKSSNRKWLTARELLNMIAACDTNFYNNRFTPNVMIEANEKAYYAAEYEEAIGQYIRRMKKHVEKSPMDDEKLSVYEREARQQAVRRYDRDRKMGSDRPHRETYEKHLIEKCEEYFTYLKEQIKSDQNMRAAMRQESTRKALRLYDEEMQANEDLKEEELKSRHVEKYKKIFSKYKGVADMDELQRKVKEKYDKLRICEQDRLKELDQKKPREKELFTLITVKLKASCSEKWKQIVTTYRDQASMEKAKQEIEQETREKYWNLALMPTEKKYRTSLEKKLKAYAAGSSSESLPKAKPRKSDDQKTAALVDKICEEFQKHLQIKSGNPEKTQEQHKKDLVQAQLMGYYQACCEHLPIYFKRLDGVLMSCYKDACRINEEIWESIATTIRLTVNRLILEHECDLKEFTVDRRINADQLKSHYSRSLDDLLQSTPEELSKVFRRAERAEGYFKEELDLLQSTPEELSKVFRRTERAKGYFKEELDRKMSDSLKRILEQNQRDKEKRLVEDTTEKLKNKGFLGRLKNFFGWSR